ASEGDLTEDERASLPRSPYFLYPANLWPYKNHRRLFQAFARFLGRTGEPFELVLTGDDAGWPELRADFAHLPIRHLGHVRRALLEVLYQRARALVYFSLDEGFGLPILEAFRARTPVACGNSGSMAELAGTAALTCDPADAETLCETLTRIAHEENLRQRLSV